MALPPSAQTVAHTPSGIAQPLHPLWVLHWPLGSQPVLDAATLDTHQFTHLADVAPWCQASANPTADTPFPLLLITCPPLTHIQQQEFCQWVEATIPQPLRRQVALATKNPIDSWVTTLFTLGIGRYIDLNAADGLAWLTLWQRYQYQRQHTTPFSFTQELPFNPAHHNTIQNSQHIHDYRETLADHLGKQHPHLPNLSTAVVEAIYNACYHGPPHGNYTKGQPFTITDSKDEVGLTTGHVQYFNEPYHAFSVVDQWGRLTAPPALKGIKRHATGEGVLDVSGRGHFLMSALCNQWAVAITPNQRTEYLLLKAPSDSPSLEVPSPHLLIFE